MKSAFQMQNGLLKVIWAPFPLAATALLRGLLKGLSELLSPIAVTVSVAASYQR